MESRHIPFEAQYNQHQETSEHPNPNPNNSQEKSGAIEQKIREIEQKINPFTNFVAWDLEWPPEPDESHTRRVSLPVNHFRFS